jgi:hypothetical protein
MIIPYRNNSCALRNLFELRKSTNWQISSIERYIASLSSQLQHQNHYIETCKFWIEKVDCEPVSTTDLKNPEKIKQIIEVRARKQESERKKIKRSEKEQRRLINLIEEKQQLLEEKRNYIKHLDGLIKLVNKNA